MKHYLHIILVLGVLIGMAKASHAQQWTIYDSTNTNMHGDDIQAIAMDGEGKLWAGSRDTGLVSYDGTNWTNYNPSNSNLPAASVRDIAIEADNKIWIATEDGLASYDGSYWDVFKSAATGLHSNTTRAVQVDSSGNIWVGTTGYCYNNNGLSQYDGSDWTFYNEDNSGLADCNIGAIDVDTNGNIWAGGGDFIGNGGLAVFDGSAWTTYTTSDGLAGSRVTGIAIDSASTKWISSEGGLARYDNQAWLTFQKANSALPSANVEDVAVDTAGQVWMATAFGAVMYDGQQWHTFTEVNSPLPSNYCFSVFIDKQNTKWIGTSQGLAKIEGNIPEDTEAPELAKTYPEKGTLGVELDENSMYLEFNEPVKRGTGKLKLHKASDDQAVLEVSPEDLNMDGDVDINANLLFGSFNLEAGTQYYLTIEEGFLEDQAGHKIQPVSKSSNWTFTTVDQEPPVVTSTEPSRGATDVAVSTNFTMHFNEMIKAGSGKWVLHLSADDSEVTSVNASELSLNDQTDVLTIDLSNVNLAGGTTYYVTIEEGFLKDGSDNAMKAITQDSSWTFTTVQADNTAPEISTFNPTKDATGISVNVSLSLEFNETIKVGSGTLGIYKESDDSEVFSQNAEDLSLNSGATSFSVSPSENLEENTAYYVTMEKGFVTDQAGNPAPAITNDDGWLFSTGTSTGIRASQKADLLVYPADNFLIVKDFKDILAPRNHIQIIDMQGKIHMQTTKAKTSIMRLNISPLPEGVYLFRIKAKEKLYINAFTHAE